MMRLKIYVIVRPCKISSTPFPRLMLSLCELAGRALSVFISLWLPDLSFLFSAAGASSQISLIPSVDKSPSYNTAAFLLIMCPRISLCRYWTLLRYRMASAMGNKWSIESSKLSNSIFVLMHITARLTVFGSAKLHVERINRSTGPTSRFDNIIIIPRNV